MRLSRPPSAASPMAVTWPAGSAIRPATPLLDEPTRKTVLPPAPKCTSSWPSARAAAGAARMHNDPAISAGTILGDTAEPPMLELVGRLCLRQTVTPPASNYSGGVIDRR